MRGNLSIRTDLARMSHLGWHLILLAPFGISGREADAVLNATIVATALDPEVSLLSPMRVPRVGDLPVLVPTLDTPSHDTDGMTTLDRAGDVMVDPRDVVNEVSVNGERSLDGSSLHDCLLNPSLSRGMFDTTGSSSAHELAARRGLGESVFVGRELVVWGFRVSVAGGWALW